MLISSQLPNTIWLSFFVAHKLYVPSPALHHPLLCLPPCVASMLQWRVVRASADSPRVAPACSVCASYALDAAEHICRTLFTTLPETDAAVLSLPRSVDVFAPLNASFEEVPAVTGDGGASPPSVTTP